MTEVSEKHPARERKIHPKGAKSGSRLMGDQSLRLCQWLEQLVIFLYGKAVGHAGDVVTDGSL